MTDAERWQRVETTIKGLGFVQATETMALTALIVLLNQEIPNFKKRAIAFIRQFSSTRTAAQATIDAAINIFSDLEGK